MDKSLENLLKKSIKQFLEKSEEMNEHIVGDKVAALNPAEHGTVRSGSCSHISFGRQKSFEEEAECEKIELLHQILRNREALSNF